jgi:hypothetical protein
MQVPASIGSLCLPQLPHSHPSLSKYPCYWPWVQYGGAVHARQLQLLRYSPVCSHSRTSFSYAPAANLAGRLQKTPGSYRSSVDGVNSLKETIQQATDEVDPIKGTLVRRWYLVQERVTWEV